MKYAHRRFILALIIDRVPVPEIRKSLWSLGLDIPSKAEFLDFESDVVDAAHPSLHKYLCNLKIPKTKSKLKPLYDLAETLGVTAYFNVRYPLERLMHILQTADIRNALEGLMLSTLAAEEVVTLVNRRWGQTLSKEDLGHYRDLFWDTTEMDLESWSFRLGKCDAKGAIIRSYAISNPDEHEKIKWLAGLPVSLEYTTLLQKAMTDAFFHLSKAFDSSYPDVAAAKAFSSIMANMGDRLKKWGGEKNLNAVEAAIRIVEANKTSGNIPQAAKVHTGALPEIKRQGQLVMLPPPKKAS